VNLPLAPRLPPAVARRARWLGYAGLLPFAASAAAIWWGGGEVRALALDALLAYAAVILGFVGALHWSRGMDSAAGAQPGQLLFSVLPALLAWIALLIPAAHGLGLLMCGFVLVYRYDLSYWRAWPWFLRLRGRLTAGAIAALAVGLAGVV
jgi:hypothetical protein